MKRVLVFLQGFFLFFFIVGNAAAANITILNSERWITAHASAGGDSSNRNESTLDIGAWDESVEAYAFWEEIETTVFIDVFADASQNSTIALGSELAINASGWCSVSTIEGMGESSSSLSVTFTVANQTEYEISINAMQGDSNSIGLGTEPYTSDIFHYESWNYGNTYSGSLGVDTYYLTLQTNAYDGGPEASYDIEFTASNVPIPSAIWLLGSAFVGLVGFRKKLRKEAQ